MIALSIIEEGIGLANKGYRYIFDAIELVLSDPDILNALTKELYPSVASKNNSTPCAVERAIRISINKAWPQNAEKKPTNGEFLALLSYKIISRGGLSS